MLAVLRVILFEWILARLALRWVLLIAVLAIGGAIFFIGAAILGWRWLSKRSAATT